MYQEQLLFKAENKLKNMKIACRLALLISLFLMIASVSSLASALENNPNNGIENMSKSLFLQTHKQLNPQVLKLALQAFFKARAEGLEKKPILTVIDYSLPSNKKRLWVMDLSSQKILFNTIVAHGKNSGDNYSSTKFSDSDGSLQSSLGLFLTESTYIGHNGYTLRLKGLEQGINSHAEERRIVMHPAWYVSQDLVDHGGLIGRSWGCPALDKKVATPLINTIKNGSIIFAYYPDKHLLESSKFISA